MKSRTDEYLQLHGKITDIILELMGVQRSLECFIEDEKEILHGSGVIPIKKRNKNALNTTVTDFAAAMVSDDIDDDAILKLEDILKQKKDELQK